MELFIEGNSGGPRFASPIRSHLDIEKLAVPDPNVDLKYVMDAICLTRKNLNGRVPLIGFAGSPWTLAAYMVEGKGSKDFETIKGLIRSDPEELHTLLDKLARAAALYLNAMIDAGAQALQIFDTWGGILQKNEFHEFSLRYIAQVLGLLESVDVPIIVYCKNCGHSVGAIANAGCDVVGLDQSVDISAARKEAGSRKALQGNMDPAVLLSSAEHIREEVKKILEKFGSGNGHIFNLGHGILPDTPVDNVRALVQAVKEESVRYHL
jgi:uroporphyrinogen decarboxylase